MKIPFRKDRYGKSFYYEETDGFHLVPYEIGTVRQDEMFFSVEEQQQENLLKITLSVRANSTRKLNRLGFQLGIDTYMDSYPQWNSKYFPTALRCEKNGFWGCFVSPVGKLIAVCSPSRIVSWRNEYSDAEYDIVGHRIYTSSIELINQNPQPERHPVSPEVLTDKPITATLYFGCFSDKKEAFAFIRRYSKIHVPDVNKYTLEPGEPLVLDGKQYPASLHPGVNTVCAAGNAELSVYVRKDWFYYLDCARKCAEQCQQKPGTHCESWYGFFTLAQYAKVINSPDYTAKLQRRFADFFARITERVDGKYRMRPETLLNRLQNTSTMLSLLSDFYELTGDLSYLDHAADLAELLLSLQAKDGSYRNGEIHYTCVIYPAKSMLELALSERQAGLYSRYEKHYNSAYRAIKNLEMMMDNIQTEGQMTFEDGMISCESLQMGYLAQQLPAGEEKERLIQAAEQILQKHRCLEQHFLPDCRVRGCTSRFWEARYDINFFSNMMNSPHGWTSWKSYATYYLYLLTGKPEYLIDTMDTLGACMQCVDETGVLHWGYVLDPCVCGQNLKRTSVNGLIETEQTVVGECYLPMISDWWRQDPNRLINEYLVPWNQPEKWNECFGGSCDNDVHEHFKCLMETVFGKAFVHQADGQILTYNCKATDGGFTSPDPYLKQWIVYAESTHFITLNGKTMQMKAGFNYIDANGSDTPPPKEELK